MYWSNSASIVLRRGLNLYYMQEVKYARLICIEWPLRRLWQIYPFIYLFIDTRMCSFIMQRLMAHNQQFSIPGLIYYYCAAPHANILIIRVSLALLYSLFHHRSARAHNEEEETDQNSHESSHFKSARINNSMY
jgi:hypothetical protein